MSGWTLQNSGTIPGLSNLKDWLCPLGQVPMLCPSFLLPLMEGQKTLCATLSLLRNSTVVPCSTTTMCGTNIRPFWSMMTCTVGVGKVLPATASTYTTDSPLTPETLP